MAYFKLLKFLLIYIFNHQKDTQENEIYIFLIKNKLSNLDLTYIALYDMVTDDEEFSNILEKFNFYENYDEDDDEVHGEIIMLINYKLLANKLSKWITKNAN